MQGTSEGTFDNGGGERLDVAAAIEYAEFAELPHIWVVGWSFGTDLALMYGCDPGVDGRDPAVAAAAVRPSPSDLAVWAESGKPVVAIVPEFDDYLRPDEARERFAGDTAGRGGRGEGGKHLWVGQAERALDLIVRAVDPGVATPLPTTWDGPIGKADASAYADRTVASFADVALPEQLE